MDRVVGVTSKVARGSWRVVRSQWRSWVVCVGSIGEGDGRGIVVVVVIGSRESEYEVGGFFLAGNWVFESFDPERRCTILKRFKNRGKSAIPSF